MALGALRSGFRPEVSPIVGAQFTHAHAENTLDRLALIRRHPAGFPVREHLDREHAERLDKGDKATGIGVGSDGEGIDWHAPMLNPVCSQVNGAFQQTTCMNRPWQQFADELERRAKPLQWLATRLSCSIQRVQNWTTRGVPRAAFPEVAEAFGESIDWVAGLAPPKWQEATKQTLSEDALALAAAYEKMSANERQRLRLLLMAARDGINPDIARAPGRPAPAADFLGGMSNFGKLDELARPVKKTKGDPGR